MSIIYDALKKIEKTHPQQPQKPTVKKPESSFLLLKIFAGLLILVLLFFLINPLIKKDAIKTNTADKTVAPVTLPLPTIPVPEKIKEVTKTLENIENDLKGKFVLNGVFFTDDQGYALINNRITKEGDSINDALVQRITLEEVELNYQGTILKLNSASKN